MLFRSALIAIIGMLAFGESAHALRLLGIAMIIAGVVTLNLSA